MEKRKRELGILSSIARSTPTHDGEGEDGIVTRRYSAHKLNNISEGLTLSSRYPQNKFHDDDIVYEKDAVGSGIGSGLTTTTTMNPLHAQNMI